MIPQKIQPYFQTISQRLDGDNTIIEGLLTCCNSHEFEVCVVGEIRCGMFSKVHLLPKDEEIELVIRCKRCGNVISVFNSGRDGYGHHERTQCAQSLTKPFACKKCLENDFSVKIKYEYPDIRELENLDIIDTDNAFTWIWVTLICNRCGIEFKNFIDFETD